MDGAHQTDLLPHELPSSSVRGEIFLSRAIISSLSQLLDEMPPATLVLEQNFINMPYPRLEIQTSVFETDPKIKEKIATLLGNATSVPRAVGLAPGYTPAGTLTVLAIAVHTVVLVIQFRSKAKAGADSVIAARKVLQEDLLDPENNVLFAFNMAMLAASLYHDTGLRVGNAVDIQDSCACKDNRDPANAVEFALNVTKHRSYRENLVKAFSDDLWDPAKVATTSVLALKAWLSGYLPGIADMEERFRDAKRINLNNTEKWPDASLLRYAQWARTDQQLDMKKAPTTSHSFTEVSTNRKKYTVHGERFQNRLRASNGPVQMSVVDTSGAQYMMSGNLANIKGRMATLKGAGVIEGKTVTSLASTGQGGPTFAEADKAAVLLRIFQEQSSVSDNCFLRKIWPDGKEVQWPESMLIIDNTPPVTYDSPLNDSQLAAVQHMLSLTNETRITMIQGPPGTGKTTVIAAFVHSAIAAGLDGIWLVAQSNVAVKNIGEKLLKSNFDNWKLLVSLDFHEGWHEHLYNSFAQHVIRSDEFKNAARELQGCQVILCTLSMLSNRRLNSFTTKVPIKTLVIDEASQINVNDYMSLLERFSTLHKLCFIGDDKQLPPYGQEEVHNLKSIFELSHLHNEALFLNTQYRMPPFIGDFISSAIYDGQLRSHVDHPVSGLACWFVDVDDGQERRNGTSWENHAEQDAVLTLAQFLVEDEEKFRIITPYDAQRNALQNKLQSAGLPWQDKCFNVDSFQGNEDDVIIISIVRSQELGFLKDLRRTNVMLTRCKRAMYIFSSWDFLNGPGAESLVGRLAAHCGDHAWLPMADVIAGNF